MKTAKIGFLPLYIKLYDDINLDVRGRLDDYYESLAKGFEERGIEVIRSPFCRIEPEFKEAVSKFEAEGADCIVTWHAAYSPSLESIEVLKDTKLPIVVLDCTDTYDFGPASSPDNVNACHGIHGVMDMTSLLRRYGKAYAIAAGHYPLSDVMDRAVGYVRAAVAAHSLAGTKVGTIGGSFDGMGDFLVSDEEMMERFGVEVVYAEKKLVDIKAAISDEEVRAEMALDLEMCDVIGPLPEESHYRTAKNCLAVRHWLESEGIDAFTVNFRKIVPDDGLEIMPFMEASKAMARDIGYAGEGDVLTAAITGALMRGFGDTSFVEIFCPDWRGGSLMLSHMGEHNLALGAKRPEIKEIPFIFGEAVDPVVAYGRLKGGEAVFVNIFRGPEGFEMLAAPVTMLDTTEDSFEGVTRGFMKPHMPVERFLEEISYAGVTHHSSLVYGATPEQIAYFAKILGMKCVICK